MLDFELIKTILVVAIAGSIITTATIQKIKEILNKLSTDYEYVKNTNWKECKEIIDNIDIADNSKKL